MSSPAEDDGADVGLLTPVCAGTAGERLTGDRAVVAALVRAEAALLHALVDAGVAPAAARTAAETLASLTPDARALALAAPEGGNPVIPLVRLLRGEVDPALAPWVHHGATSQDIVDTALMLVASRTARQIEADLARLAGSLAELADRHRAVPMTARTLTQQAMPTTLGMRLAGWLAGVHDAVRALRTCTWLPASLGGPVGTATAFGERGPAVLEAFATRLGLGVPVSSWHTRRTPVLDLVNGLTFTGEACGKIAADLLVMSQSEIGEAREGTAGGSSSMSHKANPTQSVLVGSAVRQLPGLGCILASTAAPEQERPAGDWHAEWQPLRTMLRLAAAAAERTAELLPLVHFDEAAMRRNLDQLLAAADQDRGWERDQLASVGTWVDRVLAQHEEVLG